MSKDIISGYETMSATSCRSFKFTSLDPHHYRSAKFDLHFLYLTSFYTVDFRLFNIIPLRFDNIQYISQRFLNMPTQHNYL